MDLSEKKLQVEQIFQSAVSVCSFERSFVLRVEFEQETDMSHALNSGASSSREYRSQQIFYLSKETPLIVFSNGYISTDPNSGISGTMSKDFILEQHPYHSDYYDGEKCSFLYKDKEESREAPTYFAQLDKVQEAVMGILNLSIPDKARDALLAMSKEGFSFSLDSDELADAASIIKGQYPEFTDDVFNHIASDYKYEQLWKKGENLVTLHFTEKNNNVLHARGASTQESMNNLMVFDVYPE